MENDVAIKNCEVMLRYEYAQKQELLNRENAENLLETSYYLIQSLESAIDSLRKQTIKTPVKNVRAKNDMEYLCPICFKVVDHKLAGNYCIHCGQKFEWHIY